jgi:ribonuclease P protein subunit POP4
MVYHPEEFIGLKLQIKESKNKSLEGISGIIIDETKKTFKIKTPKGNKLVLKKDTILIIDEKIISGNEIEKRPEERIKKR